MPTKHSCTSGNTKTRTKPATVPVTGAAPAIFVGDLQPLQIHLNKVAELEPQLREARRALLDYAEGEIVVIPNDTALLEQTDALRQMMEAAFQHRLAFHGEARKTSGPEVIGTADVETIKGLVVGVIAGTIESGMVRGSVKAETVEDGGQAFGVKVDRIG